MDEQLSAQPSNPAAACEPPPFITYVLGVAASFSTIAVLAVPALWMALIH
jgi:hypothetical protein